MILNDHEILSSFGFNESEQFYYLDQKIAYYVLIVYLEAFEIN